MRMWMINPKLLCRKHLLGEHVECHMAVGAINKKKNLDGYIRLGCLELQSLEPRHNVLVEEMQRRGYHHQSPLPSYEMITTPTLDIIKNQEELYTRCENCRKIMDGVNKNLGTYEESK